MHSRNKGIYLLVCNSGGRLKTKRKENIVFLQSCSFIFLLFCALLLLSVCLPDQHTCGTEIHSRQDEALNSNKNPAMQPLPAGLCRGVGLPPDIIALKFFIYVEQYCSWEQISTFIYSRARSTTVSLSPSCLLIWGGTLNAVCFKHHQPFIPLNVGAVLLPNRNAGFS